MLLPVYATIVAVLAVLYLLHRSCPSLARKRATTISVHDDVELGKTEDKLQAARRKADAESSGADPEVLRCTERHSPATWV